jgi:hypothetical protein
MKRRREKARQAANTEDCRDRAIFENGLRNETTSEGVVCIRHLSVNPVQMRGGFHEQYYLYRWGRCDRHRYSVVCRPCVDFAAENRLGGASCTWLLDSQGVPKMYQTTPDGR